MRVNLIYSTMDNILHIKNLTKVFGNLTAVNNVSFSVSKGEIFSLIGPNGSGKTTIAKSIVGLVKPTSGKITIAGKDIVGSPVEAKSTLGYIPDEPHAWNHLTGEEFLHLVGTLFNMEEDKRKKRVAELLNIYDLRGIEKGYFQNYSRGNKQKFSILASLLHNPGLLVIDEPIVGLDPKSISTTKDLFIKYVKAGGTILMVTHMLPIAEELADRIGVLDNGELIAIGSLSELRKKVNLKKQDDLEKIYLFLTE